MSLSNNSENIKSLLDNLMRIATSITVAAMIWVTSTLVDLQINLARQTVQMEAAVKAQEMAITSLEASIRSDLVSLQTQLDRSVESFSRRADIQRTRIFEHDAEIHTLQRQVSVIETELKNQLGGERK